MRNLKTAAIGIQFVVFAITLYFVLGTIALLLRAAAGRLAFGVVLLLTTIGILLAACAWTLRKLWDLSGRAAAALVTKTVILEAGSTAKAEAGSEAEA